MIDVSESGDVPVLGVSGRIALVHAADLSEEKDPHPLERAAIDLAEVASRSPDERKWARPEVRDAELVLASPPKRPTKEG